MGLSSCLRLARRWNYDLVLVWDSDDELDLGAVDTLLAAFAADSLLGVAAADALALSILVGLANVLAGLPGAALWLAGRRVRSSG